MSENKKSEEIFDFVIVGGGISGLYAAHLLKKSGKRFLVIDPSFEGGSVQSKTVGDFTFELGATTFRMNDAFHSLLEELKLTTSVEKPALYPFRQYVWDPHSQSPQEVPKSPPALLKSKLFTWREKFALVRGLFKTRVRCIGSKETVTVSIFFGEIFSPSIVSKVIAPVLNGIFGGDPKEISVAHIFPGIYENSKRGKNLFSYMLEKKRAGAREIFHLKGGNHTLIAALLSSLTQEERILSSVTSILRDDSGSLVVTTADNQIIKSKSILCATAARHSATHLESCSTSISNTLGKIRSASLTMVHIQTAQCEKLLRDGFGMLFPTTQESDLLGILQSSLLFPSIRTKNTDSHVLTLCYGGVFHPETMTLTDEQMREKAVSDVMRYLNITDGEPLNVKRWKDGIPQYERSHCEFEAQLENFELENPGFYFIGSDTGGIGVPDRLDFVARKVRTAEKIGD